jgi:hypothetical protein
MRWWIYILIIAIIILGGGAYYILIFNAQKKIIATYNHSNSQIDLILPEIISANKTVTSTPAIQGMTVVNIIGTPTITVRGMTANTLYTFSVSGYENSNPIYTGTPPTPAPTLTVTKTDTSVTITHPIIASTNSYQFFILPFSNQPNTLPTPFTYYASSQTSNIITFSNITPYRYACFAQATNATSTSFPTGKMISIPLMINNPIIAVCDVNNYNQVYLYFNKGIDAEYPRSSITSIPSLPSNSDIIDSTIDNGLAIGSLTSNVLYQFSITGITGTSNSIFMGQGNLASANVTPVITKVSANSFTASIPAVTGASSYQFIVYDYNLLGMGIGYLYSAVTQTTSTITYSNVPHGTYKVTIQASSSIGTKVGISSNIVIPQP